jgi:ATP-dependent Clp protease adaptor protein ClpS
MSMLPALPAPGTRVLEDTGTGLAPMYHLVLLDDDDHTYEYVIVMLGRVFGYEVEKAYAIACVVDSQGRATVMTGSKDEVTRKQNEIHSFGADPLLSRCKGPMSAIVEPV